MTKAGFKKRLIFCSQEAWRQSFLCQKSEVFKNREKFIYGRSSTIPRAYTNDEVSIYSGKKWITRYISRWMLGYKFGEFTWNKKIALYKAKQLKKKKK